jgi:hypothetical protein
MRNGSVKAAFKFLQCLCIKWRKQNVKPCFGSDVRYVAIHPRAVLGSVGSELCRQLDRLHDFGESGAERLSTPSLCGWASHDPNLAVSRPRCAASDLNLKGLGDPGADASRQKTASCQERHRYRLRCQPMQVGLADVDQALDLINSYKGRKRFVGVRQRALIEEAEAALGVRFPPSYRRFLESLGAGSIRGREIYGVIDSNFRDSTIPDGIWLTLMERQHSRLPEALVIVYSTGERLCCDRYI